MTSAQSLKLVVGRAMRNSEHLPLDERADLYEAVASLLEGDAAEQAKLIAFSLRTADAAQLTMADLLRPEGAR